MVSAIIAIGEVIYTLNTDMHVHTSTTFYTSGSTHI